MYSRTISPEMTNKDSSAVEYRLNEFWTNARLKGAATNRGYDSIFRIAEAQAKLNLSREIDDDIATISSWIYRILIKYELESFFYQIDTVAVKLLLQSDPPKNMYDFTGLGASPYLTSFWVAKTSQMCSESHWIRTHGYFVG
jgi:hypothetical protein